MMRAGDAVEAADGDAVAVHRHQEDGDAVLLRVAVTETLDPGQQVAPLGPQGPRGPGLLAADPEPVAVGHGLGGHVGQVGTGVGLAEPLAPEAVAPGDLGEVQGLLLLGAVVEDRRAQPVGAVVLAAAGLEVGPHLLAHHDRRGQVEVLASVLLGPVGDEQPLGRQHLAEPIADLEVGRVVGERPEPPGRQVLGDQAAQLGAQQRALIRVLVDERIGCAVRAHRFDGSPRSCLAVLRPGQWYDEVPTHGR